MNRHREIDGKGKDLKNLTEIIADFEPGVELRYGANPHQKAYVLRDPKAGGIANAEKLWGKPLSANNLFDADAAWGLLYDLRDDACVIVKHANPCGVGQLENRRDSFTAALECDRTSAFGGIIGVRVVTRDLAELITTKGNFFEVIVACEYAPGAVGVLQQREGWGQNVRVLRAAPPRQTETIQSISGGVVVQEADPNAADDEVCFLCATEREATEEEYGAAYLQWQIVKWIKSNGIAVGTKDRMLGMGTGQPNRVQSVRLALEQAGEGAKGAALASDGFFPFPDSISLAHAAGITMIIQPGGSKKDDEVIAAANVCGMAMIFTQTRHFRH